MKRSIAIGLIIAGALMWFDPGFNGFLFERSSIDIGTGRIISAILLVGGVLLLFLPEGSTK